MNMTTTLPERIEQLRSQISEMRGAIEVLENPPPKDVQITETEPLKYLRQAIATETSQISQEQAREKRLKQAREALAAGETELAELERQERHHRKLSDEGWEQLRKRGEAFQQRVQLFIQQTQADLDELPELAAQYLESEHLIYGDRVGSGIANRRRQSFEIGQFFEPGWRNDLPVSSIATDLRKVAIGRWSVQRESQQLRELKQARREAAAR